MKNKKYNLKDFINDVRNTAMSFRKTINKAQKELIVVVIDKSPLLIDEFPTFRNIKIGLTDDQVSKINLDIHESIGQCYISDEKVKK